MAAAPVQSAEGTSTLATVTVSFPVATTPGNVVVLTISADDYNTSPGAGWTESTGMEQMVNHGGYLWWRKSNGETSFQYTIGSATNSSWTIAEYSGLEAAPYWGSAGKSANGFDKTYTTPSLTPPAGDYLMVAAVNFNRNSSSHSGNSVTGWTNSFTGLQDIGSGGSGSNCTASQAYRAVTADGSTAYSTGATSNIDVTSASGLIIAFKVASGGGGSVAEADGTAAGSSAVSGVGNTAKAAVGTIAGTGAASAAGNARRATTGSAAGVGAATGLATKVASAVGIAAGSAAAIGAAGVRLSTDGQASGVGAATGVGASTRSSEGSAVGSSAMVGQTGPDAAAGHSMWRVLCTHRDNYCSVAEITMSATPTGADQTSPLLTIFSSEFDSTTYAAKNVFDDNTSTDWFTSSLSIGALSWVGQDFGTPTNVAEITIRCNSSANAPSQVQIQFSEDGSTWITTDTYGSLSWVGGDTKTFAVNDTWKIEETTGSAAGTSSASGVSGSRKASDATATGVGTVAGVGATLRSSQASAVGSSTANAVSTTVRHAQGQASGSAGVVGVSGTFSEAEGTASGTSAAAGVGHAIAGAVGTATGQSTVTGDSEQPGMAEGHAAGTSTVLGVSEAVVAAVGEAGGTSEAVGESTVVISVAGTAQGTSSVVGDAHPIRYGGTDPTRIEQPGPERRIKYAPPEGNRVIIAAAEVRVAQPGPEIRIVRA